MKFLATWFIAAIASLAVAGEISVVGEDSTSRPANTAYVSVAVITEAKTPTEALAQNSTIINKVTAALIKLGIQKTDMQTGSLELSPKYSQVKDKEPVLSGYVTRHVLKVTVCKIEDTGKVLDTSIKEGATSIDSIRFGLSADIQKSLIDTLRANAAKNANEKAKLYATTLGIKVKSLKSLSEVVSLPRMNSYAERAAMDTNSNTNIEGGAIVIKVQVSTVWETE